MKKLSRLTNSARGIPFSRISSTELTDSQACAVPSLFTNSYRHHTIRMNIEQKPRRPYTKPMRIGSLFRIEDGLIGLKTKSGWIDPTPFASGSEYLEERIKEI